MLGVKRTHLAGDSVYLANVLFFLRVLCGELPFLRLYTWDIPRNYLSCPALICGERFFAIFNFFNTYIRYLT